MVEWSGYGTGATVEMCGHGQEQEWNGLGMRQKTDTWIAYKCTTHNQHSFTTTNGRLFCSNSVLIITTSLMK